MKGAKPMDGFTIAWATILGAGAAVEAVALVRKRPGDTLSEHMWRWFATQRPDSEAQPSGWVRLRRFALLSGMVWLTVHFVTGGWV